MSNLNRLACWIAAGTLAGVAPVASAATQVLYLFDQINNPTPDTAPYEELADASGNGLDLVRQDQFGAVSLTTDRPAVMPTGTFALDSVSGGTGSPITPNTDALSVAKTGELTVEFWYNPKLDSALSYIMEFGNEAANGWDIYQAATGGNINIIVGFRDQANGFNTLETGSVFTTNSGWFHVAATFASDGTGTLYIDGQAVDTAAFNPAVFQPLNSYLRLGAGLNASFSGTFLMDELRISDVALAPGAGTGVGELAWGASLVPEPASLGLLCVGGAAMIRRRR